MLKDKDYQSKLQSLNVVPKSVTQRVEALRKRRALLGQTRRDYYLTDNEKSEVDHFIKKLRQKT